MREHTDTETTPLKLQSLVAVFQSAYKMRNQITTGFLAVLIAA